MTRNKGFLRLHPLAGIFHVFVHNSPRCGRVAIARRAHKPQLVRSAVFPEFRVWNAIDPATDCQILKKADEEAAREGHERIRAITDEQLVELKFRDSLLALFLDRRGGMVVDFHFRFEPGEISLAEAARDACGRLRLETDTQLVVTLHEIWVFLKLCGRRAGRSATSGLARVR
ncbi:MAG: hypothetical protein WBQ45_12655, partial [Roseiarcus sp.]